MLLCFVGSPTNNTNNRSSGNYVNCTNEDSGTKNHTQVRIPHLLVRVTQWNFFCNTIMVKLDLTEGEKGIGDI